jgi:hypothetical protein
LKDNGASLMFLQGTQFIRRRQQKLTYSRAGVRPLSSKKSLYLSVKPTKKKCSDPSPEREAVSVWFIAHFRKA